MSTEPTTNLWTSAEHALGYLARVSDIPRRVEGETALLEHVPPGLRRVLDLGSGDGRLLALVLAHCPHATGVALDFSQTMLERLHARFDADDRVKIVAHSMDDPLAALGSFDAVVSSFAIHHVSHDRKRALYAEIFELVTPRGVFCNLEHVSSPTGRLHEQFLAALGIAPADEDPSNKLLDVHTQIEWLRAIGFDDVDCHWKWRELALLAGVRPAEARTLQP